MNTLSDQFKTVLKSLKEKITKKFIFFSINPIH